MKPPLTTVVVYIPHVCQYWRRMSVVDSFVVPVLPTKQTILPSPVLDDPTLTSTVRSSGGSLNE